MSNIKIACNYYPEVEQLAEQGLEIDYYKFPALPIQMEIMEEQNSREFRSFMDRLTAQKPVLLHGLYPYPHDLSDPKLKEKFLSKNPERLLAATKTPGVSLHTSLSYTDNKSSNNIKTVITTIKENILFLKQEFSRLDFFTIENLDNIKYGPLIYPEVITEIVTDTDCGFLLDISHAYCSAFALGMDLLSYLSALPLHKVVEIHMNGWQRVNDKIMCHIKIHEEGYKVLEWVLDRTSPKILTLEYGRHNDKLNLGIPLFVPGKINRLMQQEIVEQITRLKKIKQ